MGRTVEMIAPAGRRLRRVGRSGFEVYPHWKVAVADLTGLSPYPWSEIVVDGGGDPTGTYRADPLHLSQPLRIFVNDRECALPEGLDDAAAHDRANAFDQSGAEVALHALQRSGEDRTGIQGLELPAMFGIVDPEASGDDGFSRLEIGQGSTTVISRSSLPLGAASVRSGASWATV